MSTFIWSSHKQGQRALGGYQWLSDASLQAEMEKEEGRIQTGGGFLALLNAWMGSPTGKVAPTHSQWSSTTSPHYVMWAKAPKGDLHFHVLDVNYSSSKEIVMEEGWSFRLIAQWGKLKILFHQRWQQMRGRIREGADGSVIQKTKHTGHQRYHSVPCWKQNGHPQLKLTLDVCHNHVTNEKGIDGGGGGGPFIQFTLLRAFDFADFMFTRHRTNNFLIIINPFSQYTAVEPPT